MQSAISYRQYERASQEGLPGACRLSIFMSSPRLIVQHFLYLHHEHLHFLYSHHEHLLLVIARYTCQASSWLQIKESNVTGAALPW